VQNEKIYIFIFSFIIPSFFSQEEGARYFAHGRISNLIMSLWPINYESTKILINHFYDYVKDSTSYLNAL
jgi:hypothetical protein